MNEWPAPEHARAAAQREATLRVFDALEDLRRGVEALRYELPTRGRPSRSRPSPGSQPTLGS